MHDVKKRKKLPADSAAHLSTIFRLSVKTQMQTMISKTYSQLLKVLHLVLWLCLA